MKHKLLLLSLLLLWGAVQMVCAAPVKYYTINEGMANNAVYSIIQDTKGRMWFGTIDGLHSFDGTNIRVWRDKSVPSLGSIVYTIHEDDHRRLWLGTNQGLAVFDLRTEKFWPGNRLPDMGVDIKSWVCSIMQDCEGELWVTTMGQGIFRFNPSTGQVRQYLGMAKTNSDSVTSILEDHAGEIWTVSAADGVARFDRKRDIFVRQSGKEFAGNQTIFEDSQHNLWVGSTRHGLLRFDRRTSTLEQVLKPFEKKRPFQIVKIVEWQPGELMLASDEGLTVYHIASGKCTRYDDDNNLEINDKYIHSLCVDREGALWVGTYFGGVNYIAPRNNHIRHYCSENTDMDARIIGVFAHADHGNLWLGTDDAGFFYWDRTRNRFKSFRPDASSMSPTYKNIHALLQDGDRLFVGMYVGGLDILDLKRGTMRNYQGNSSSRSLYTNHIYSLYKDSYGRIWIGTTGGLNRYNPVTDDFDRIYEVSQVNVTDIMEDSSGALWACTSNRGVFRLDRATQKWQHFFHSTRDSLSTMPSNQVQTIAQDDSGDIWLGTNGDGLLRFDSAGRRFVTVPLSTEIRVIQKLIAQGGGLWLSTANGLYEYDLSSGVLHTYNKDDGLQDNYFLPNSGIRLSDGTLLFGGINGFNEIHPTRLGNRNRKPEVLLSDFRLFNKPVDIGSDDSPLSESITYAEKLVLDSKQSVFSFSVNALNYGNASKTRYRYKMEGLNEEWIETRRPPSIMYVRIPSGSYTFRVSVSTGDGIWYEDIKTLPVEILPPWWASWWAIAGYVVLLAGGLCCVFVRMNRRHRKRIAYLSMEKDREIYRSKMEFFTLMIHEIRTPLTLILAPLDNIMRTKQTIAEAQPELQIIERNGKRLLSLVNQLMDFRKVESHGMDIRLQPTDIKSLLIGQCQQFAVSASLKNITLVTELLGEEAYANVDAEAFTKVVSNLLSNSLKFTSTHIWVTLAATPDDELKLTVRDNGVGISPDDQQKIFRPFYQVNRPADNVGTGIGLLLVKKMVDLMSGTLQLESRLGMGTSFSVSFKRCAAPTVTTEAAAEEMSVGEEVPAPVEAERKEHTIMVVDDNADLQEYLRVLLGDLYTVVCTGNGEEALKVLAAQPADLVISDVMMPVMDGIELCRRLKNDIRFSHLPVILLTAKVSVDSKVEGLECGADFYIEKPFSSEVLRAQIASIFTNREHIRGCFQSDLKMSPATDSLSRLDAEFFERVSASILEHLSHPDFGVEELAREAGISRSGLFAKMKTVSGMTPNEYIRLIRLKRAAELLSDDNSRSVSEICFCVGFSSPSYFAKCFQQQYGVSPTDFRKKCGAE